MGKSSAGAKTPTYHCSDLDEVTLRTPSPDRPFFIRLENNITIYVDQHDYNLYVRPLEVEKKKAERRSRCIIAGKRCIKDCSKCRWTRSGNLLSLEQEYKDHGREYADKAEDIVNNLAKKELQEALARELGLLPEEDQKILKLHALDMSTHEIAKALDMPQRTVYDHLSNSFRLLKEKLSSYK